VVVVVVVSPILIHSAALIGWLVATHAFQTNKPVIAAIATLASVAGCLDLTWPIVKISM